MSILQNIFPCSNIVRSQCEPLKLVYFHTRKHNLTYRAAEALAHLAFTLTDSSSRCWSLHEQRVLHIHKDITISKECHVYNIIGLFFLPRGIALVLFEYSVWVGSSTFKCTWV